MKFQKSVTWLIRIQKSCQHMIYYWLLMTVMLWLFFPALAFIVVVYLNYFLPPTHHNIGSVFSRSVPWNSRSSRFSRSIRCTAGLSFQLHRMIKSSVSPPGSRWQNVMKNWPMHFQIHQYTKMTVKCRSDISRYFKHVNYN